MNVRDPLLWRQYLENPGWGIERGPETMHWREFHLRNPSGNVNVRSMLMFYEIAILYALAKDHYVGAGAIVDAGPLTGVTTNALAKGVMDNPRDFDRTRRIFSFDLFDSSMACDNVVEPEADRNGSIFDVYLDVCRDYLGQISIAPGDLLRHSWNSGPIEILFLDLSKSWDLNDFIVDQWFPELLVGAHVVQQDYFSWFTYWLPVTMMALSEYFEFVDYAYGASAVFRCVRQVPHGLAKEIRGLGVAEHARLIDKAIESAPASSAEVLKASKGCLYLAHGMRAESEAALASIRPTFSDDPATNFAGMAEAMADSIRQAFDMLDAGVPNFVPRP